MVSLLFHGETFFVVIFLVLVGATASSTVFISWLKSLTKSLQDDGKTLFLQVAMCDVRVVATSEVMQRLLTKRSVVLDRE